MPNEDKPDKPGDGRSVKIFVNNRPVNVSGPHVTGAEIKSAAGVSADFKLYDAGGNEIADDKKIKVKEGDRFTAISGQDVS